jgi:hypothetical protein
MIYSDKFVWIHIPKCAGSKIWRLFAKYYSCNHDIHQDPIGFKNDPLIRWHHSIAQRENSDIEFSLGDRDVICSFRRLPSWLESRYNYEVQRTPNLPHDPKRLLKGYFLNADGSERHADHIIKNFLYPKLFQNSNVRFIRVEFFKKDFKKIFSDYIDVSIIPEEEFSKKVNTWLLAISCG